MDDLPQGKRAAEEIESSNEASSVPCAKEGSPKLLSASESTTYKPTTRLSPHTRQSPRGTSWQSSSIHYASSTPSAHGSRHSTPRSSPFDKNSPMPASYIPTYSPFLMDSYVSLGLNGSVHGFSSPASFFSGCPDDSGQQSEDDIYTSLSHLPSTMNTLQRNSDDTSDDEEDESNLGLWNCIVCTKLNQTEQCSFCGSEKEKPFQPAKAAEKSTLGTAIGFDERMQLHREIQPRDMYDMHPERPDRIAAIFAQCQEDGVVERCAKISDVVINQEDLLRCHSAEYLQYLDEIFTLPFHHLTPDTYCCAETKMAANLSAGIVMTLMEKVVQNEFRNGFAIVRPPGHHAEPQHAMGFCMYNNVAVAAKAAVHKLGLERVLILDWDIHHGNGTEHMFEDDPTVLYCSLHRFDGNGAFYPGTGSPENVGSGKGKGYNVNIGWPGGGVGDAEYLAAFDRVLMPIFRSFSPQLVLVSAGFDSAMGDPLGRCRITPAGYANMTHLLCSLAGGKVVMALEGGYNLQSISRSASACIRILLGDAVPALALDIPMDGALEAIETTRQCLSPYWPCLGPLKPTPNDDPDDEDKSSDEETQVDDGHESKVDSKLKQKRSQRYQPYIKR